MLTVAVPNKGSLSEGAISMLIEAGYKARPDGRDLASVDAGEGVRFYFLRPRDVAVYVGSGDVDLGITGRDMAADSGADVSEQLSLGFGGSQFRYAGPIGLNMDSLAGKRIATSYPLLVADDLAERGIGADIIRLDGAVEISVELGVADAVADVVSTGRTLAAHGLAPFGPVVCVSEAIVVARAESAGGAPTLSDDAQKARRQLLRRLEGVTVAHQFVMVDYDCPRDLLDEATALTPGLESPTIAPLRDDNWVAVRVLVPKSEMNSVIDALADLGAKAILASELRSARL